MPDEDNSKIHLHKPFEACYPDCPEPHYTRSEAELREHMRARLLWWELEACTWNVGKEEALIMINRMWEVLDGER